MDRSRAQLDEVTLWGKGVHRRGKVEDAAGQASGEHHQHIF